MHTIHTQVHNPTGPQIHICKAYPYRCEHVYRRITTCTSTTCVAYFQAFRHKQVTGACTGTCTDTCTHMQAFTLAQVYTHAGVHTQDRMSPVRRASGAFCQQGRVCKGSGDRASFRKRPYFYCLCPTHPHTHPEPWHRHSRPCALGVFRALMHSILVGRSGRARGPRQRQ